MGEGGGTTLLDLSAVSNTHPNFSAVMTTVVTRLLKYTMLGEIDLEISKWNKISTIKPVGKQTPQSSELLSWQLKKKPSQIYIYSRLLYSIIAVSESRSLLFCISHRSSKINWIWKFWFINYGLKNFHCFLSCILSFILTQLYIWVWIIR